MKIPRRWKPILEALGALSERLGIPLYAVGGCVRDWILGFDTLDLDFAVEGDVHPFVGFCEKEWKGESSSFGRFGTSRVFLESGLRIDFAGCRSEKYAKAAELPHVRPASIHADLSRRDFTVNAMALGISHHPTLSPRIIDPWGGMEDLKRKRIRVLHDLSFRDDPTRIMRASRYAWRFGMRLDSETAALLSEAVREGLPSLLSRERIRQEVLRILAEKNPGGPFGLLKSWRALKFIHPHLRWTRKALPIRGEMERLGVLALAMGPGKGRDFLRGLHLERGAFLALDEALRVSSERSSPRTRLPELAKSVLAAWHSSVGPKVLEPLMAGGSDLKGMGIPPGKRYADLLKGLGRAQWTGNVRTRNQALSWLKRRAS